MPEHIADRGFGGLLEALAAKTPTPGGGAAASAVGALGVALGQMVLAFSTGKKSLAEHSEKLHEAEHRLAATRDLLLELASEDEAAYGLASELSRLPEADPRRGELPAATLAAARVPLACLAACVNTLRLLEQLPGITNRHLRSDLAIAAVFAEAGARAAAWNVEVNLPGITDEAERSRLGSESSRLLAAARTLCAEVERACRASV